MYGIVLVQAPLYQALGGVGDEEPVREGVGVGLDELVGGLDVGRLEGRPVTNKYIYI